MEINNENVARRIESIRSNLGLSMERFGEMLNTSKASVNNWEKGKNLPNNERLKHIAELGNVEIDELLYGDPNSRIYRVISDWEDGEEEYIPYVINYFSNKNIKYPSNDEIRKAYDYILNEVIETSQKRVAGILLGYHVKSAEEYLYEALKDDGIKNSHKVKSAIEELTEAVTNYEIHFDRSVDELYEKFKNEKTN